MKRITTLMLAFLLFSVTLAGCAKPTPQNTSSAAVVPTDAPVTLTMLCNWNDAQAKTFADTVHTKLPHITLQYEACPIGAQPYADEVTRRIQHDAQADIFVTTDTNLWDSGKLLPLTNEAFVSKYNLSIMNTLSGDGSVYFVPALGDVLCYIYNEAWLQELDLPVPQTDAELDSVFAAMAEAGKNPFLAPYSQTPTQYVKVLIAGYLSTPKGQQWMQDYNSGKTTMAQDAHWQTLWKRVEEMAQKGYLRSEDMGYTETRRLTALQEEAGFMTTFPSAQDNKFSDVSKEIFKVLPLLGEKPENQMVYTAPTGYFAVSNALAADENSAKRAAAMQVLDFISTTEGQELLCAGNPLAISYLSDTTLPVNARYESLAEIIKKGAYTPMPMLQRGVESVIEDVFAKVAAGKMTAADAAAACDKQNASYEKTADVPLTKLGSAAELFPWTYMQSRTEELAVIDFCMDSVCKAAGTDYALEIGTAFRGEFFKGDITTADLESVIRQDKKLYVIEVTGQQIWDIINQGVTFPKGSAWFVAPAGFCYSYERLADNTGKLLTLTLADGTPIDLQKTYSVTVSENQVMDIPNLINFSSAQKKELPVTLREAVAANIKEQGIISPKTDGRIQIVGTK